MQFINIPIPGKSTAFVNGPWVEVQGIADEAVHLVLKYIFNWLPDGKKVYGEFRFKNVFEYRFRTFENLYEDFPELEHYPPGVSCFGLIDIQGSPYIENLLSKGPLRNYPGERLGHVLKESDLHHYAVSFDDYGAFDILALEVSVREYIV